MTNSNQRLTLFATSISYVLVILDTSIVNVALADIAQGLGTEITGLQWVVTSYVAVFASLVLSGGALADTFGARRIYIAGLMLFTIASLVCGAASSLPALIVGRVLQGVGAALLVPCALSLLTHTYPDNIARAKAIASWASWGGVAQILGPLAGGVLLALFDWRSIFLVNIPICLAGLWLTLKIDRQTADHGNRRLDWPGQISVALAMILLIAALIEGHELGWSNRWVLAGFALSILSALAFIRIEQRASTPMLPLALFANPQFAWIVVTMLTGAAAFFGILFVMNLYFLQGAGYTPLQTGLAMMPLAIFATAGNLLAARLAHKMRPLTLMIVGGAVRLIAFVVIAAISAEFSYALLAAPLILIGLGGGLSNPMAISTMISATDKRYAGIASGISTATGQLGAAIGVAVFGAFLADPLLIADGTRNAALVSLAVTAMNIVIIWRLRVCRD